MTIRGKIKVRGTRAETLIIPTHYGAERIIIPTRAPINASDFASTPKNQKGGKEHERKGYRL